MIIHSRKDYLFKTITFSVLTLFSIIIIKILNKTVLTIDDIVGLIIIGLTTILLIWIFYGTFYKIEKNILKYYSGPIRGCIDINKIRTIYKGKTKWVGMKPATATKGLIIKYDKFNDIYISPKSNDDFIKKLLEINNKIKVM